MEIHAEQMLDADCETRDMVGLPSTSTGRDTRMVEAIEMWWHTRRNQISSFGETDESI